MSAVGLGQKQESGYSEDVILTAGDNLEVIRRYVGAGKTSYSAKDVIDDLRSLL
jgi:hypothetical protein